MQQPDKHTLALPFEVINWFHHPFGRAIKYIFTGFLLACGILATTLPLQAGTITWVGGTDNNWATGANWDSTYAPGPLADVVIALDGVLVTLPNGIAITVNSLTLGGGTGAIETLRNGNQSSNGFRLTVTGNVTVASDGHLDIRGTGTVYVSDSLKVDGTLTNNGLLTLEWGSTITGNVVNNGAIESKNRKGSAIYGSLTNNAGSTLDIFAGINWSIAELSVNGDLTNAGRITLYNQERSADPGSMIYAYLKVNSGTFTNTLTGAIIDSSTNYGLLVRSITSADFDNQGTLIAKGYTALDIGVGPGLVSNPSNSGHIHAQQSINFTNVGTFTNSGTITIDTLKTLTLSGYSGAGTYTGSGEQFQGNGTLVLSNVALGVTAFPPLDSLSLTMGSNSSLTLTDSLIVCRSLTATGSSITAGGVRNQGTFSLDGGGSLSSPDKDIINNGTLVLSGGTITGAVTNNDSLNVSGTATITGAVTNGSGGELIMNSASLSVDGGLTNHGYLLAENHLAVTNGQLVNSATGTVSGSGTFAGDLVNQGLFEFSGSTSGGNHSNSGTFRINQGGMFSFQSGATFTNTDTVILDTAAILYITSGITFTNTGTVILDTTATLSISSATYQGEEGTLEGTGTLYLSSSTGHLGQKFVVKDAGVKLSMINSTIHVDSLINQTTLTARGDTVYADSVIINQGKLTLMPYYYYGLHCNAWYGPFINQDTLIVEPISSYSANEFLGGPVVNEPGALISVNSTDSQTATLTVDSSLTNHGKLELKNADDAAYFANLNVNKGWLTNTATGIINYLIYGQINADLDNQGGLMTVDITSTTATLTMNKNPALINNSGTIHVKAGEYFKVQYLDAFTNTGTVRIDSGTALQLVGPTSTRDGVFDNTVGTLSAAGTLLLSYLTANLGPKFVVSDSMTLSLSRAVVNTDSLINQGYLSVFRDTINGHVVNQDTASFGYWNTVNGSFENQAGAVLQLIGDLNNSSSTLTVDSALTNAGVMDMSTTYANSRGFVLTVSKGRLSNGPAGALTVTKGVSTNSYLDFKVDAPEHVNQGILTVDSAAVLTIAGTSFDNESGGVVQGKGTLDVTDVAFTNAGTVNPGGSPGILAIDGDLTQAATGVISIEIEGDNPGTGYDQLNISGTVALAGSLKVQLIDPYNPADGTTFLPLTYGSSNGVFESLTSSGGGTFLSTHITETGVYLTAGMGNSWPYIGRIADITALEDTTLAIALQTFDPDEGDVLVFNAVSFTQAVAVAIVVDTLKITPELNWNGRANIKVVVADPAGLKDSTEFVLTLTPVQDKPLAFDLLQPRDDSTVVITPAYQQLRLGLTWDRTEDPDGDYLYQDLVLTGDLTQLRAWSLGSTSSYVYWYYSEIIAAMSTAGKATFTGTWTIAARDQADTTEATNGPFNLTIDASAVLSVDGRGLIPEVYALHQNHPNPFNPTTTLRFDLPEAGDVTILVYDLMGRAVARLVERRMEPGYHAVVWSGLDEAGRQVPTGVYIVRMESTKYTKTVKMVLLK